MPPDASIRLSWRLWLRLELRRRFNRAPARVQYLAPIFVVAWLFYGADPEPAEPPYARIGRGKGA